MYIHGSWNLLEKCSADKDSTGQDVLRESGEISVGEGSKLSLEDPGAALH